MALQEEVADDLHQVTKSLGNLQNGRCIQGLHFLMHAFNWVHETTCVSGLSRKPTVSYHLRGTSEWSANSDYM